MELVAPGEGEWTAIVDLTLRRPNAVDSSWSTEVVLGQETLTEAMRLPPGVTLAGPALLVGWVTFVADDGRRTDRARLGGRFVEVRDGQLVASASRFAGSMGGERHDPHDDIPADDEMPPLPTDVMP